MESSKTIMPVVLKEATGNDIQALCLSNEVHRSAHIGNLFSSNIVGGKLGAKFVLFDLNTQKEDDNNKPSLLLLNRVQYRIGDEDFDGSFSPFVPIAVNEPFGAQIGKKYLSPANFHYLEAKSVFPGQVETQSEYMLRHSELVEKLVHKFVKELSYESIYNLFDRSMTQSGRPDKQHNLKYLDPKKLSGELLETHKAFVSAVLNGPESTKIPENPVIPDMLFIALTTIVAEASKQYQKGAKDLAVIYHLAGPDMPGYITSIGEKLDVLYKIASEEIPLPKKVLFAVIPTAHLKLVTIKDKKIHLNLLLEGLQLQKEANIVRKKGSVDPNLIREMKDRARQVVKKSLAVLNMDLRGKLSDHLNQHDLSLSENYYAHPLIQTANSKELEEIYEQLVAIDSNGK